MRTYLRIFNPLIALLIFILCSFAAVREDKDKPIVPRNIIAGGIQTYFFAKGLVCEDNDAARLPTRDTLRKALAPDFRRVSSEREPDSGLLPEQQNGQMSVNAIPTAILLIGDSLSRARSGPSRPLSIAPSCREIRPPKIRSRTDRAGQ